MKTILVATDFSSAGDNAVKYGFELARAFNARLILFNAYQVPPATTDTYIPISGAELEYEVKERLLRDLEKLAEGNQVQMTAACKGGSVVNGVLKTAMDEKADLIITGMKSTGKGTRRFFGSTVTTLARITEIPMLVVPEEAAYKPVSTIALANETDIAPDADHRILDSLRELAERFHSRVYLVRIAEDRFKEAFEVINSPFQITRMLSSVDPVYECIEGPNVAVALEDFAERHKVDILALLPHKHSLLERWFVPGTTREMILETTIPLLIIPDLHRSKNENYAELREYIL